MVGHHGLGHFPAFRAGQAAGFEEDPEPLERAALAAVGDIRLVLQGYPGAGGGGEVPDCAARARRWSQRYQRDLLAAAR